MPITLLAATSPGGFHGDADLPDDDDEFVHDDYCASLGVRRRACDCDYDS